MALRYYPFRSVGQPQSVLERIRGVIKKERLGTSLSVLKIEKKARREFYLFIGADQEDTKVAEALRTVGRLAGLTPFSSDGLSIDQISGMTSGKEIQTNST